LGLTTVVSVFELEKSMMLYPYKYSFSLWSSNWSTDLWEERELRLLLSGSWFHFHSIQSLKLFCSFLGVLTLVPGLLKFTDIFSSVWLPTVKSWENFRFKNGKGTFIWPVLSKFWRILFIYTIFILLYYIV